MNTRTFTLDDVHAAYDKRSGPYWRDFEAALLAAKPEAKTCERWCCVPYDHPGAPPEPCSRGCANAGRPLNPAPAASPPAWLPLGRHPGGECKDNCGKSGACVKWIRSADGWLCHSVGNAPCFCSRYCRDRAEAVPRDAAKDSPPVEGRAEEPNPAPEACRAPRASSTSGAGGGQPGVPDGWKLGDGWWVSREGDHPECIHTSGPGEDEPGEFDCNSPTAFESDRWAYCLAHAKQAGAIVPTEPSRPKQCTVYDTDCLMPDKCTSAGACCAGEAEPSRPVTGEAKCFVECQAYAHHRCVHSDCIKAAAEKVTTPAPGNHPGIFACNCSLQNGLHRTLCPLAQAPGKPDEAPLMELRMQLAAAKYDNYHLKIELATRDARIAELDRKINRALGCLSEELK